MEYLGRLRWPNGFACPACGGRESLRTARRLWMCARCGLKTSATAGTVFHRSHSPLSSWFGSLPRRRTGSRRWGCSGCWGSARMRPRGRGCTSCGARWCVPSGSGCPGSWSSARASSAVSPGRRGPASGKAPVMIAVERISAQRLGRIRLRVAKAPGTPGLVDFACEVIEPGSVIRTDGAAMFRRLAALGYAHEPTAGYSAPDPTPSCPEPAWSHPCSNAGPRARSTSGSASSICPTTLTSSPSGSAGAGPGHGECSSAGSAAGSRNRAAPAYRADRLAGTLTALKQICRTYNRLCQKASELPDGQLRAADPGIALACTEP